MPMAGLGWDVISRFSFLKEFIQKCICGRGFSFRVTKGDLLDFYPFLLVLPWECPFLYLQIVNSFSVVEQREQWALLAVGL